MSKEAAILASLTPMQREWVEGTLAGRQMIWMGRNRSGRTFAEDALDAILKERGTAEAEVTQEEGDL